MEDFALLIINGFTDMCVDKKLSSVIKIKFSMGIMPRDYLL